MAKPSGWMAAVILSAVLLGGQEAWAACVGSATNICVATNGFAYVFDMGAGFSGDNPPLTLTAGTTYTFMIASTVPSIHPFAIEDLAGTLDPNATPNPANANQTMTWAAPAAGTFQYICTIHLFGNTITVVDALDGGDDAGQVDDGGADAGGEMDAGPTDAGLPDSGTLADAGSVDAGPADGGLVDAGPVDAGEDGGMFDAGLLDAGARDAGTPPGSDAGPDASVADAGRGAPDSGSAADAGGAANNPSGGCGCGAGESSILVLALLFLTLFARRQGTPARRG